MARRKPTNLSLEAEAILRGEAVRRLYGSAREAAAAPEEAMARHREHLRRKHGGAP